MVFQTNILLLKGYQHHVFWFSYFHLFILLISSCYDNSVGAEYDKRLIYSSLAVTVGAAALSPLVELSACLLELDKEGQSGIILITSSSSAVVPN